MIIQGTLLAVLATAVVSSSPQIHPLCEAVGYRLLFQVHQGQLTDNQAADVFRRCQIENPPFAP